jgi:hypothetical protein
VHDRVLHERLEQQVRDGEVFRTVLDVDHDAKCAAEP